MKVKKLLNHVYYEQMVNILEYNSEEEGYLPVSIGKCKSLLYGSEYDQDLLKRKVETIEHDGKFLKVYLKEE